MDVRGMDPNASLIQFNAPEYYSGGAEGGTDVLRPQTIKTIAGIPVDQFIQRKGPDSMGPSGEVGPTGQVFNPLTGQWETGYVVPGLDNTQLIPESIAKQIPGSGAYAGTTPKDVHDYTQGLQALGIVAGGVLGGGAITSALGGAGAVGGAAGLGPMGVDSAGIFGGSGAAAGEAGIGLGGGVYDPSVVAGTTQTANSGIGLGGYGGLQQTGTPALGFNATASGAGAFNSGIGTSGLSIPGTTALNSISTAAAPAIGSGAAAAGGFGAALNAFGSAGKLAAGATGLLGLGGGVGGGSGGSSTTSAGPISDAEQNLINLQSQLSQKQLDAINAMDPYNQELLSQALGQLQSQGKYQAALDAAISPEDQAAAAAAQFKNQGTNDALQQQLLQMQVDSLKQGGMATDAQKQQIADATNAALTAGTGDINTQTQRGIGMIADELANSRGLRLSDSPITGEAALLTRAGNDQIASLTNNLRANQANATLNYPLAVQGLQSSVNSNQQQVLEASKQFQDNLRQQAYNNRLALTGPATTTGLGLSGIGSTAAGINATNAGRGSTTTQTLGLGQTISGIGNLLSGASAAYNAF